MEKVMNGKSHPASRYMPFRHDTFWHFSTLFGDNWQIAKPK
jgi:hypothetical protein